MTRSTAREIAAHLAYELSFTELPIQEFLDQQLSDECFAAVPPSTRFTSRRPTKNRSSISAVW